MVASRYTNPRHGRAPRAISVSVRWSNEHRYSYPTTLFSFEWLKEVQSKGNGFLLRRLIDLLGNLLKVGPALLFQGEPGLEYPQPTDKE
jgi:hypothetical protein